MKTTYNDMGNQIRNPDKNICEAKEYESYSGLREHGRNHITLICPFCQTKSHSTLWGFSGSGKRCENKRCGAVFGMGKAYKLLATKQPGG